MPSPTRSVTCRWVTTAGDQAASLKAGLMFQPAGGVGPMVFQVESEATMKVPPAKSRRGKRGSMTKGAGRRRRGDRKGNGIYDSRRGRGGGCPEPYRCA